MTNLQHAPQPSHDVQPLMVHQRRSPFILSQVAKDKFGSSANIRTAPKEEVEDVTGAARICKISNSVGTNTTQGMKAVTATADKDADPMDIPADTEARNINGFHVDTLVT